MSCCKGETSTAPAPFFYEVRSAGLNWSPQQEAALKAVAKWLADPKGPQVFRLFGFAGVGKTTLAKEIAGMVKGAVLYATFTGKAALVLRKKGCAGASTIHSLIYRPEGEDGEQPVFVLNRDSALATAKLAIIDEVSQVNEVLGKDLLSFKTKILVLGDPAQLPPVSGEGFFINAKPDFMLTEIHRQAADNPIIRMSMDVREGRGLQVGTYGDSRVVRRGDISKDEMRALVMSADQLLCGTNKSRQAFNDRVREIHGRCGLAAPHHPVPGDRLVCLRNDREKNLLNGGLWEAVTASEKKGKIEITARSLDDVMPDAKVKVPVEFFSGTEKELPWEKLRNLQQFTYGYALTVHKSQGSQWDNVVLFDESRSFRDNAVKHLYTAVTRAAERITVVV